MDFDTTSPQAEQSHSAVSRVLNWLTAGYPEGIPPTDRFAVVALLKRRLTDDDIREIHAELTAKRSQTNFSDGISRETLEELITKVLREQPSDDEIRRVSAHLAAGGWPLAWSDDDAGAA